MNAATLMWSMGFALSWIGLAIAVEHSPELVSWAQTVGFAVGIDKEIFNARG